MSIKVVIITEGGTDVGVGHITRCISFCHAFEEREIQPEIIVNGDSRVKNLLNGQKYCIFNWLKERNRLFDLLKDASIVIIDSYLANMGFYREISEITEIPVYIDDNKRIDYPSGFVVNGAVYAGHLDYPQRDGIVYLLGSRYTPLRREFWDVSEKDIKKKPESIMITFGGDDSKNMTPKILKFLNEEYPKLTKNVIIGKGFCHKKEIENLKSEKTNFVYNSSAGKMKEVMLESDIAISAGGQTIYELARVGVPTVGICVAENQLRNLQGWEKCGFVEYVGWYNDGNLFQKIEEALKILDYKKRTKMSRISQRFVNGQGARRVVRKILKWTRKV